MYVVARSERPVAELDTVRAVGGDVVWSAAADGWHVAQISDAHDELEPSLVSVTGAPALLVRVLNSDFGLAEGYSPDGWSWLGVLGPVAAEDYGVPEGEFGEPDDVAELAVDWAHEAGREPDLGALAAVLRAEPAPLVEDLVLELFRALGFRFRAD